MTKSSAYLREIQVRRQSILFAFFNGVENIKIKSDLSEQGI